MSINKNNYKDEIVSATALLLYISEADENIDNREINIIKNIIFDFFDLKASDYSDLINISLNKLNKSTDVFEFGMILNKSFNYTDKVDFVCCAFEVAYSDKILHFKEEHFIKKIANILDIEHSDLINAKSEIKKYL